MTTDIRSDVAKFYDLNPDFPQDVPFYQALIPSPQATILELGCGTGRVTLALAPHCRFMLGIDLSPAMIEICLARLGKAEISSERAVVSVGDMADFDLGQRFDLIIAPFRVLQNLESDAKLDGLFRCIGKHLAPGGTCVLNVFRPFYTMEEWHEHWPSSEERLAWEAPVEGGRVTCSDRRTRINLHPLVLYPDLIYRRYAGADLAEEAVLHLTMRCYYPDTFEKLVSEHGFRIVNRWGGYAGEAYGEGPELVLQFQAGEEL